MEKISYRIANENDIKRIVEIIQVGNQEFIDKLIYGCKGIEKYIESCINDNNSDLKFFVATREDYVIGALEIKIINNIIFINYIAIDPKYRCKGIGKGIIKYSLNYLTQHKEYNTVGLDVFKQNIGALNLYKKLGFRIIKEYEWISISKVKNNLANIQYDLIDYQESIKVYKNRGFSNLTIKINNVNKSIGILGEKWFRVKECDIDNNLVDILFNLDNRKILLIKEKDIQINIATFDTNILYESYRMEATIKEILNKL